MRTTAVLMIMSLVLLASCTNIEITENDIFDVKKTISPDYFNGGKYDLEEIHFATSDGLEIEGWYIKQADAERTVLFVGGNGFVIAASYHIITSIIEQGVNLLVFNFRGFGKNPGKPSVEGVRRDVEAAYDFLIDERRVDPYSLIVHGHSIGTLLAGWVAQNRELSKVVLESPVTDAEDLTSRLIPWFLKPFVHIKVDPALLELRNTEHVSNLTVPLLIVTGGADNVTPKEMAEELYEIARIDEKRLEILEGGGHNDLPERGDYRRILREFYLSE